MRSDKRTPQKEAICESYAAEILAERQEKRRESRVWLESFICQTPPTYEDCKDHLGANGMIVTKKDYEDICKNRGQKPQYRKHTKEIPVDLRLEMIREYE